jgi:hypothetical protein
VYAKEKMKKGVKIRLIVMSLSAVLPIILLILFDLPFFKDRFVVYSDLFVLRYAIFVLLEGYIVFKIYRYIRFFCDVEYADLFVLRKTDERLNFVRLKTNALVIKILIYVSGIAMITAGFFNAIVFYTILCMMIAVLLMYLFVYLYYSRKY